MCRSRHLVIWSRNHKYSVLLKKDHWSYYQSISSEFRYVLRKVLGTQDCPTLRLASHLYVLRLNLIKNMFNTCIFTHTHTSIHLSIQHGIFHSKQNILIHLPKQKRTRHIKETLAFIYDVKTYHTSKTYHSYHKPSINKLKTLIIDLSMFHHILRPKHKCMDIANAWLTSTYLSAALHLWHRCMSMWMNGIKTKKP